MRTTSTRRGRCLRRVKRAGTMPRAEEEVSTGVRGACQGDVAPARTWRSSNVAARLGVMRLDVLLHELRLFKTRSQAAAAIEEGRVRIAGRAAKPSRAIERGERITLLGPTGERTLEVLELPRRSLSKAEARDLVREVNSTSSE